MNIAIFTDAFYPQVNGVVTSIMNSSRELIFRGHRVIIFAPMPGKGSKIREDFGEISVVLLPSIKAPYYPDIRITSPVNGKVMRILKDFKVDIIHFHVPFSIGVLSIICAKLMKKPLVGSFHTFFAEEEYLRIAGMENCRFLKWFVWRYCMLFYSRCDAVIAPSRYTAEELVRQGVRIQPIIIPNGVHLESNIIKEIYSRGAREKYGLSDNTILFVGRVSKEKSIDVLLRAAEILSKKVSDFKMIIVGDGPSFEDFKKMSRDLGINDRVIFTGMIPHEELLSSGIFQASKIFVTASRSENQPMTILEAMLFGLPVIGVNRRGVPELIDGNGFLVEADDHEGIAARCLEVLENDELRLKLGKRSSELALNFNIKRTTDMMEDLYARLSGI